jgi:TonB family protein
MNHIPQASWLFDFVLNATWKIALIFLVAKLTARLVKPLGPRAEHRVWVSALFLEILLPAFHLRLDDLWLRITSLLFHPASSGAGEVRVVIGPGRGAGESLQLPDSLVQPALFLYLACTCFFAARLIWGLWKTHQLTRSATPAELPEDALQRWKCTCHALQMQAAEAQICTAPDIISPMTVGLRRRKLLLPPAFVSQVTHAELEAALAHECAHMRRQDFARNLLYSILAVPVAFHPLLWRTLAGIAESRELICDELAAGTSRSSYARSLVHLAEWISTQSNIPESGTLHAIGIFDANIFERRIMRLTHPPTQLRGLRRMATLMLCFLAATVVCASALAWHVQINPSGIHPAMMADPPKRIHVKAEVMQGNLVSQVRPEYPEEAKAARIQGKVVLRAVIDKEGTVDTLAVQEGPKELQQSALDAVRQWKYKPFLLNGDPIEVETTINVIYSLGK